MRVALAADHAGFQLKEKIKEFLQKKNIPYQDFGAHNEQRTDFVDWGVRAIEQIIRGDFERGILVCGTGLGMNIIANKFSGIRATPCYNIYTARMAREHNNSNVLTLGGRVTGTNLAKEIVKVWLTAKFQGERHQRRLNKIKQIEERNFK